jgi:glycosyltransferase involved in cell wall biosynthesis
MISIGIPVYEMGGQGISFLDYCLGTIYPQTFSDYEIVISDHSKNDEIKLYCQDKPKVKYFRNEHGRGFLGPNFNNVIQNCSGDIIKFIQQDDYFFTSNALEKTVEAFGDANWLMGSYWHTYDRVSCFKFHLPKVSQNVALINLLGYPTALTIKNGLNVWFDETLKYFVDSDFYMQLQLKYGDPVILESPPTTVQLLWSGQTTNSIITQEILNKEFDYLVDKYVTKKNI